MEALQPLSTAECWELLSRAKVGRLAFTERALPSIVPLNVAVVGRRLMLRVRSGGLADRLDRQVVAFEIDDADATSQTGWSVVVTGVARRLSSEGELVRSDAVPASWAGPDHQTLVAITPGDVQGRRLVSVERVATPSG